MNAGGITLVIIACLAVMAVLGYGIYRLLDFTMDSDNGFTAFLGFLTVMGLGLVMLVGVPVEGYQYIEDHSPEVRHTHCRVTAHRSEWIQPAPVVISTGKSTTVIPQAGHEAYTIASTCGDFDGGDSSYRGTVIGHSYTITTKALSVVAMKEE